MLSASHSLKEELITSISSLLLDYISLYDYYLNFKWRKKNGRRNRWEHVGSNEGLNAMEYGSEEG